MPKKGKGKKPSGAAKSVSDSLRDTALGVVDEIEKAGGVVLGEVKSSLDFIGGKVADTARVAADTTVAVKDKVTGKEMTDQLHVLVKEVEEIGESLIDVIGAHFKSLRESIAATPKKAGKKTAAGKKANKKARKKVSRKKTAAGKKAVKKGGKKTASRKKTTAKKKTTKKKTTKKKTAAGKKGARKKTASGKKARKKAAGKR